MVINPGSLTANPGGNNAVTTYTGTGDPVLDGWCGDQYTSFLKASGTPSNVSSTYTASYTGLTKSGSTTVPYVEVTTGSYTYVTTIVPTPYVAPEECVCIEKAFVGSFATDLD